MKSAADLFVTAVPTLPGAAGRVEMYAGDLPARESNTGAAALYFQLHRARHPTSPRRLLLWLNGGPGCSSLDGVMMEIGAWRTRLDGTLGWAPDGGAWNEYTDVLFLDQPVGTGFSYAPEGGYVSSLTQTASEVRYFLQQFVAIFPEYQAGRGVDFWIAGESFAGQYIPYTAHALLSAPQSPVQLRGVAIGNGFLDPQAQHGSEMDLLVQRGIWPAGGEQHRAAQALFTACREALNRTEGNPRSVPPCDNFVTELAAQGRRQAGGEERCINIYDVRLDDSFPSCGMNWPPNIKATYSYLRRPEVRDAFHVDTLHKPEPWVECSGRVGRALNMASDSEPASVTLLPTLLQNGIKVLIFAGDQDLICNHVGLERMLDRLTWAGQTGFSSPAAEMGEPWHVNGRLVGKWHTERNLTYVRVYNASHMVPFDKPVASHDMMLRFMGTNALQAAGPLATVPSHIGLNTGHIWSSANTSSAEQPDSLDKAQAQARSEAYFRAGSLVLIIVLSLGVYLFWRHKRRSHSVWTSRPDPTAIELDPLVQEPHWDGDTARDRPSSAA